MKSVANENLKNLRWIEELLPAEVVPRRMHGGIGYYLDEKLVLILVESSKTREHKGITYPFEIWNGCLMPIEKMKQNTVWSKFPFLENHPASKNWLYLPAESQDIEEEVKLIIRELKKRNPLFGIFIKIGKSSGDENNEVLDTSKPQLFSIGPVAKKPAANKTAGAKKTANKSAKNIKKVKADKKAENNLLLSVLKRKPR